MRKKVFAGAVVAAVLAVSPSVALAADSGDSGDSGVSREDARDQILRERANSGGTQSTTQDDAEEDQDIESIDGEDVESDFSDGDSEDVELEDSEDAETEGDDDSFAVETSTDGTIVAFGDSYFADGGASDGPGLSGCPQNKDNVPGLIAQKLGMELKDYSCSGAVAHFGGGANGSQTFDQQIDMAIGNGDLNEDTTYVPISMGGNDGMAMYMAMIDPTQQQSQYLESMSASLDRIRDAAPNAFIQLVGYPSMTGDNGATCSVNAAAPGIAPLTAILGPVEQVGGDVVGEQEHTINNYQRALSNQEDIQFVDLKESTLGLGPCSSSPGKLVSTSSTFIVEDSNMPLHLTRSGNEMISDLAVQEFESGEIAKHDEANPEEGMNIVNKVMSSLGGVGVPIAPR